MKVVILSEKPKNKKNLDRLVEVFRKEKLINKDLNINLKIVNRIHSLKSFRPENNDIIFVFGSSLYRNLIRDIQYFDKLTGIEKRDIHKYTYLIKNKDLHYIISLMPPVDYTVEKVDSFMALESSIKIINAATLLYEKNPEEIYFNRKDEARAGWNIDLIELGFQPKTKIYIKHEEVMEFMDELFALPDWSPVAVDVETTGLEMYKDKHDLTIASFSYEESIGHAINLGLPRLPNFLSTEQKREVLDRLEEYIFDKPKIFIAWKCDFDIFSLCNKFKRSYYEFVKNNKILDGIQLLHTLFENRKVEGYSCKVAARDFLNYKQYSYINQYLDYIKNPEKLSVSEVLDRATNSLIYAATDAVAEYNLAKIFMFEIDKDDIIKHFKNSVMRKIMNQKLQIEWNGMLFDKDKAISLISSSKKIKKNEIELIRNSLIRFEESDDDKMHPELFLFSATTGRLYYGKPFLNQLTMGSEYSRVFKAGENKSFMYIDLSAAELRMGAFISQDKNLIDDLNQFDDFYVNFAKKLFSSENIKDEERTIAKEISLSILNLVGPRTIAQKIKCSEEEAKQYITTFYSKYPGMKNLRYSVDSFLKNNHFVFSASFRKRRFSEEDMSDEKYFINFLSAHNFLFQSSTSDMMLLNCDIFTEKTREEFGTEIIWFNHDAALFVIDDKYIEDNIGICKDTFSKDPAIISEGVAKINEYVLGRKVVNYTLKTMNFKNKILVGKSLDKLEDISNAKL